MLNLLTSSCTSAWSVPLLPSAERYAKSSSDLKTVSFSCPSTSSSSNSFLVIPSSVPASRCRSGMAWSGGSLMGVALRSYA